MFPFVKDPLLAVYFMFILFYGNGVREKISALFFKSNMGDKGAETTQHQQPVWMSDW